jgi:hypothetical protein
MHIFIIHIEALAKKTEIKDLYRSDTNKTRREGSFVRMSKGKTSNV